MATEQEIKDCFNNLRREIANTSSGMRGPRGETRLLLMGIFLLESFLLDVKRIADAIDQDGMANK